MNETKHIAKKTIIVYILNILRHTCPERPINQTVICNYLNEIHIPCDRKTVGRNIEYLQKMGYPIQKIANKGVYLDTKTLLALDKKFIE